MAGERDGLLGAPFFRRRAAYFWELQIVRHVIKCVACSRIVITIIYMLAHTDLAASLLAFTANIELANGLDDPACTAAPVALTAD